MNIQKVLVVVAHPDDEVLGCGGFIKKLTEEGKEVRVLYLNNGCNFRDDFKADKIAFQISEVAATLGFKKFRVEKNPALELDKIHHLELNKVVDEVLLEYQPDTVITHQKADLNKDHIIVHDVVMVCCRFKAGSSVKNILTFAAVSSSDISPNWDFTPNFYVDITKQFQSKVSAMTCYKEELAAMLRHRGVNGIEAWAKFYGLQSNMEYAEAFKLVRGTYE